MECRLHNFTTGEKDLATELPEDFTDYLEEGASRNLYRIYVEHDKMTPLDAFIRVAMISLNIKEE